MRKKMWICLALLIVIPGLLFTVSCAKKVVQSEPAAEEQEAVQPEPQEDMASKVAQEQAAQEEAARQWQMASEEDLKKEQAAEAAAKAEEMERAKMAARQMFMNEDIYFEFDSSVLLPMAREVLSRKAQWLRENPNASIIIEGHCDERGTNAYNIALGERRAESAKSFLVDSGIDDVRLTTISYGEERPVDPGHNEEAWAKNRRAHFVIE
ncbi:MAG: peptidoglycan-associated lipoprotein Pal [Deltaproteobacteria bacterium]